MEVSVGDEGVPDVARAFMVPEGCVVMGTGVKAPRERGTSHCGSPGRRRHGEADASGEGEENQVPWYSSPLVEPPS